ncbi:phage head spike fiber domain-containing protein [Dyadobacter bucti]|uniref:phage head spike fiber domain-containing protein n=1 Tax=Dyadobacter bucti TaxID=2572203 RepID=UPI001109634A|nr:heparin lyase I family protein [Dyadobacter bucti]
MADPLKAFDFRRDSTTNDFSFNRDSEASFYGSNGYLQFSANGQSAAPDNGETEPIDENLLGNGQNFSLRDWNKVGTSVSVPGNITAADGSSKANKITENGAKGEHRFSQSVSVIKGESVTISIYAKAGTKSKVQFSFLKADSYTGGSPAIKFNLATGSLISKSTNVISYEAIDSGNGWWLLKVTGVPDLGSDSGLHLYMLSDNNSISYQGDSKYVYAWGAQLTQGTSSTARVAATAGGLRFNYDLSNSTPKMVGALIEPAGTNLVPYSQLLTHASWRKQYATLVTNSGKAPDGTATVFKIKEDRSSAQHYIMPYPTMASSNGSTYTFSAFLKAAERKWAFFNINGVTVHFDLANGTIGNYNNIFTPYIESAGNGWYRCSATFKVSSSSTSAKIGCEKSNGSPSYAGDGNSGVLVWGAQFEKSNQLTSYIRTQSGKASRSADKLVLTKPSASSFDVFIQRTDGGTWINNSTTSFEVPTTGSPLQLVNFYSSDITVSAKDDTVQDLFPPAYQNVGISNTLVTMMDNLFMAQTPNKSWSLQQAQNKNSPIFRFQVNSGDKWSGDVGNVKDKERCEFYMKNADLPFDKDVWLSYAIKIAPGSILNLLPVEWCYLGQMHATEDKGEMSTGPVLGFRLEGSDTISAYTASSLENPIKTAPKYIFRGSSKFARGVWHKVVVRMRFSPTKGQLQWWQNGKEIINISNIGMGYVDRLGPYWKFGIYRSAVSPTLTVEYANMEVEYNSSLFSRVAQPLVIA